MGTRKRALTAAKESATAAHVTRAWAAERRRKLAAAKFSEVLEQEIDLRTVALEENGPEAVVDGIRLRLIGDSVVLVTGSGGTRGPVTDLASLGLHLSDLDRIVKQWEARRGPRRREYS
jgi:hypothetical protein